MGGRLVSFLCSLAYPSTLSTPETLFRSGLGSCYVAGSFLVCGKSDVPGNGASSCLSVAAKKLPPPPFPSPRPLDVAGFLKQNDLSLIVSKTASTLRPDVHFLNPSPLAAPLLFSLRFCLPRQTCPNCTPHRSLPRRSASLRPSFSPENICVFVGELVIGVPLLLHLIPFLLS